MEKTASLERGHLSRNLKTVREPRGRPGKGVQVAHRASAGQEGGGSLASSQAGRGGVVWSRGRGRGEGSGVRGEVHDHGFTSVPSNVVRSTNL